MVETKIRGRPKAKEKMEQITIKLPPKMLERLRRLSDESYNPMSLSYSASLIRVFEEKLKKLNYN
jgi:hypothetical protein